jgi:hypothetical protein
VSRVSNDRKMMMALPKLTSLTHHILCFLLLLLKKKESTTLQPTIVLLPVLAPAATTPNVVALSAPRTPRVVPMSSSRLALKSPVAMASYVQHQSLPTNVPKRVPMVDVRMKPVKISSATFEKRVAIKIVKWENGRRPVHKLRRRNVMGTLYLYMLFLSFSRPL